jgi:predicted DsbA family dithiol-disulfide isomerase
MRVDVYSDIACPWCYLGKHRFERALAAFPGAEDVEVVYHPYRLDPDAPARGTSHRAWLDQRYGPQSAAMDQRVADMGRAEGVAFDFDHALHADTLDGHRLLHLALTEHGPTVQADLHERLFAARFAEGADIGDHEQLADRAAAAGIDRDRAAAYLADGEGRAEVLAEFDDAARLGIRTVPTYVFEGRWAVSGAQDPESFLDVLGQVAEQTATRQAASEQPPANRTSAGTDPNGGIDADGCTDDSCAV